VVKVNGGVAFDVTGAGGGVVVVAVSPRVAPGSELTMPMAGWCWANPTPRSTIATNALAPTTADTFLTRCDRGICTLPIEVVTTSN
jgi:hypothetical protein